MIFMKKRSVFRSILMTLLLSLAVGCTDKPQPPVVVTAPSGDVNLVTPDKEVILLKLLNKDSVDLLIALEVGGERLYTAKYTRPVWPGGASGITIGIGADLGHADAATILLEWSKHPYVLDLSKLAGVRGKEAQKLLSSVQYITTSYALAYDVFELYHLPRYYNLTKRAFGKDFELLPDNAKGALVSLVFNRGSSMSGDSRKEMREIRDSCIPEQNTQCIAACLRMMKRIWKGSTIEDGMNRRREAEAIHVEKVV